MFLMICLTVAVVGQKKLKPWKEWSKSDAQKVLDDSPWAHPQVDMELTDANRLNRSRVVGTGDEDVRIRMNSERAVYAIRFLSARPVRQAFVRMIQLQQKDLNPDTVSRMSAFAEKPSEDLIVVAVTVEGPDAKPIEKVMQVIRIASTALLRTDTYLERSDGKRVYLDEYTPPGRDGFGARFIFPRIVDGKPFLSSEFTTVRFVSELSSSIKLNMLYKVKDMIIDGKVEF
jgi:hypothetical protein